MIASRSNLWFNAFLFSSICIGVISQALSACEVTIWTNSLAALEELKQFDHICSHILLSNRDRVPVNDNSISNLVCEICSDSFSNCVANAVHAKPGAVRILAVSGASDFKIMAAYKSKQVEPGRASLLCDAVSQYCGARLSGHSLNYAEDLIRQLLEIEPEQVSLEGRFAMSHGIPKSWLRSSLRFGYYTVDGPVAWLYKGNFTECVDAKEVDSKWEPLIHEIETQAWDGFSGNARTYYARVKKLLKERYGIDWLSPIELNPDRVIHLVPPVRTSATSNP